MQGRDAVAFVAAIDWTPIVVAVITLIGVIVTVAGNVYLALQLRTPSGTTIGKQVESTHLAAVGSNHRVDALARRLGSPEPREADEDAA